MPLSQKQIEYLALAWQCFDTEPKIDYDKFHKLANLASPASARELMRVTKKKLREEYGVGGQGNGGSGKKRAVAKTTMTTTTTTTTATTATATGMRNGNKTGPKGKGAVLQQATPVSDDGNEDDVEDELPGQPRMKRIKVKPEPVDGGDLPSYVEFS